MSLLQLFSCQAGPARVPRLLPAAACSLPAVACYTYLGIVATPLLFSTVKPTMSFQAKIQRSANAPRAPPSEIEQQIAQALLDLEQNVPELKTELRQLQISSAKEVDAKGGKKAVVIFVPVPQVKAFHTVQQR